MDQRTIRMRIIYGVLIPTCFIVSLFSPKFHEPRFQDFAAYWQAGHMILSGQDVYDSTAWITERELRKTALHSEPTFQYPLPFAIFFMPFGALPINVAYVVWVFLAQVAILVSVSILLDFYPKRPAYLDLLAFAGIFLFRATYITIFSGQILFLLLLVIVLAIDLLQWNKSFLGGMLLSLLTFKPSLGLPVLLLTIVWLLFTTRWKAILGLVLGGFALFLIGACVNPHWALDYVSIGGNSFYKYYGIQATIWGLAGFLVKQDWSIWISICSVLVAMLVSVIFIWQHRFNMEPFLFFALAMPVALLTAPYSWAHDHLILIIPILFILLNMVRLWSVRIGAIFLFGIVFLAAGLVPVAYVVGRDIWSVLIPIAVFILDLYVVRNRHSPERLF